MSQLIAVAFKDPHKAEEVRLDLLRAHDDARYLEEAVVLFVDRNGNIRLNHSTHFTLPLALGGGFLGTLVGLMILNPVFALAGGIIGTGLGAVLGALKEVGIEEDFMQELSKDLKPGSSALFIIADPSRTEQIVNLLEPYKGKLLQTSLSHQNELKLKAALSEASKS